MDLLSVLMKGGWLMWPIFLSSVLAIGIIIDRVIVIRRSKLNVPAFLVKLRNVLKKRDVRQAIALCSEEKTPASNIVRKGLKKYKYGHERVKEAIESAGKQEINKLEKGLSILATISGVAPLLGFLGTVTGMISAFMQIENMEGSADPGVLAGGIWEALLTTAFGLAVGIIAYTSYNFLVSRINKLVMDMEVISNDVVDLIEDTKHDNDDYEIEVDL